MQQTSILIQLLHKWLYFNNTSAKHQLITNFNYKTDLYNQCYLSDSKNSCLTTNQNIPQCFVLIQYFSLDKHAISKLLSLRQNIANPFIKTIKLIVDKIYTVQELGIKSEKLVQIVYDDSKQLDLQSFREIVSFPDSYIIFSDGYTIYNNIDSIINTSYYSIKISQTNNYIHTIIWYNNILDNLNNTSYQNRFKNIVTNLVFNDTNLLEKLICCFMKIGYKIDLLDIPEANTKTAHDKTTTQDTKTAHNKNTTYDILNIKPDNIYTNQQYPIVLSCDIDTITNSNNNIYELCIQNNKFIERICKSNIKFFIADGFSIDSVFIYKIAKYFQDTSNNVLFRELQLYSLSHYDISINNSNDLFIIIDEYTSGLNNATDCFAPHPLSIEVRDYKLVELFMSTQRLNNEYDIKLRTGDNILLNECWINNLQDKDIIIVNNSLDGSDSSILSKAINKKYTSFKFNTISLIKADINIKDYTKHKQQLYNDTIKCIESTNSRNPIVLLCTGLFDNSLGYMLYKNDISLICIGNSINKLLKNSF